MKEEVPKPVDMHSFQETGESRREASGYESWEPGQKVQISGGPGPVQWEISRSLRFHSGQYWVGPCFARVPSAALGLTLLISQTGKIDGSKDPPSSRFGSTYTKSGIIEKSSMAPVQGRHTDS